MRSFHCLKKQTATAEDLAKALNRALREDALLDGQKAFLAMPYHGKMSDADRTQAQVTPVAGRHREAHVHGINLSYAQVVGSKSNPTDGRDVAGSRLPVHR